MEIQTTLEQARAHHRAGRLAEAESLFRAILDRDPQHFLAWHHLSIIQLQRGLLPEALQHVREALALEPRSIAALSNQGLVLQALNRLDEALVSYDRARALAPADLEIEANRGLALLALGRASEALVSWHRVIAGKPNDPTANFNLGMALAETGRSNEARTHLIKALSLEPRQCGRLVPLGLRLLEKGDLATARFCFERVLADFPENVDANNLLGVVEGRQGNPARALALIEKAAIAAPAVPAIAINLGNALEAAGRHQEALASFDKAIALDPGNGIAWASKGRVLAAGGHRQEAQDSLDKASTLNDRHPGVWRVIGNVQASWNRDDDALSSFRRAIKLDPRDADTHYSLGELMHKHGEMAEARASFDRVLQLDPGNAVARVARCISELPAIYETATQIDVCRASYTDQLHAIASDIRAVQAADSSTDPWHGKELLSPFYLTYQGRSATELQRTWGSMICAASGKAEPAAHRLAGPAMPGEPVRVGIVSGYFRRHSNWKIPIKGWVSQLDRARIQLFGYHTGKSHDEETSRAAQMLDRFVAGPLIESAWRETILNDQLHVLIYPEIGMDAVAMKLAATRLAPVQCNAWGHPETSGMPTIDYYLSSDLMEPANAQDHYTERLVRLPGLSIYYEPESFTATKTARGELGIQPDAVAYWCAQSLYKYLPQHDWVLPRIARAVPKAQFVFIQYAHGSAVTQVFKARLARAFAAHDLDYLDHCVFLAPMSFDRFMATCGACDVFLDSLDWSGCNSMLESLAHDLPIVTTPGELMRGRHGLAVMEAMDLGRYVAGTVEDYCKLAIDLGISRDLRVEMKSQIAANKHRVFRDRACIDALEEFLIDAARNGAPRRPA